LGLQPRSLQGIFDKELENWKNWGVQAHFRGENPWVTVDENPTGLMAQVVGAQKEEVALMGSLSSNIHFMMIPFYCPTPQRHKIMIEEGAFPSDLYIAFSQIQFHGFNPTESLIQLKPRDGESTLRTTDILEVIKMNAESLAIVLLPGVQYYTGQALDIKTITAAAHAVGARAGWDLAHAVGNLSLALHDWNVDFACWCSYKYLNSGPGGIGGLFVHSRNSDVVPRFAGWWGHDSQTRFNMDRPFSPIPGAAGFRHSNPSVFTVMALRASLEIFCSIGMDKLTEKQAKLTGFLDFLLTKTCPKIEIISPRSPSERGCQLSLRSRVPVQPKELEEKLFAEGVVCDVRGQIIRAAPTPLYNSYTDVYNFVKILAKLLDNIKL